MRLLLVAGEPIKEPVVKYGPFVMNTEDEIRQVSVYIRTTAGFANKRIDFYRERYKYQTHAFTRLIDGTDWSGLLLPNANL